MTVSVTPLASDPFSPPVDGPILPFYAGDTWTLPLTWWQVPPVYASDGTTIVTPGVPVGMTGLTPSAELYLTGTDPGASLAISAFVAASGTWTVTAPGKNQAGDLTSGIVAGPAKPFGPRIKVHVSDGSGSRTTLGTYYIAVKG